MVSNMSIQIKISHLTKPLHLVIDGIADLTLTPHHNEEATSEEEFDTVDDLEEGLRASGDRFYNYWKSLSTEEKRVYLDNELEEYFQSKDI